jgi:hypothetical protein
MNAFIMERERLPWCSSPDKGRRGGVCSDKIGFLQNLPPQTPLNPPLSGGRQTARPRYAQPWETSKGKGNITLTSSTFNRTPVSIVFVPPCGLL